MEQKIEQAFGDKADLMLKIALCESSLRQDICNPKTPDCGLFQINETSWGEKAKELGLDYKNSVDDNIQMAKHILDTQGIKAWNPSKSCWSGV